MGLRELVERQKRFVIPIVIIGILVCAFFAWRTSRTVPRTGVVERVYFSDDEGKTYFAEDIDKGYSFIRDGKTAFRAFVYRCGSGEPFVGALARNAGATASDQHDVPPPSTGIPEEAVPATGPVVTKPLTPTSGPSGQSNSIELKKPGTDQWFLSGSAEAQALISSVCPDGKPTPVLP